MKLDIEIPGGPSLHMEQKPKEPIRIRRRQMKNAENRKNAPRWRVGFVGLVQVALIVLKLLGVIRWSWLWALFPIWVPVAANVVFAFLLTLALNKLGE